jgi:hypothetical protein
MKLVRVTKSIRSRVAVTGAAVAAVLAAFVATALGGPIVTKPTGEYLAVSATLSPPVASTAKSPVGSVVEFHLLQGNRVDPAAPETSTDFKIKYPKGSAINSADFPQCKVSLDPNGFSSCAANTSIGTGTAEGSLPDGSGGVSYVPVQLKGYNGGKLAGKPSFIFQGILGGQIVAEFDFQILNASTSPVLDDFTIPGTTPSSIGFTQFNFKAKDLTTKVKGETVHLETNPTSCPKSGWKFTVDETLQEAGTLEATSTAPCTK